MKNPLKRFVDYVIDRGGDRVAERLFERYGDDMAALFINVTQMFIPSLPPTPEAPPKPGLRSV